ncbi:MAG: hypothetical protein MI919_00630 [Holophagales bacterium]|nr:hypothetical protein [Holophagales bacterium]
MPLRGFLVGALRETLARRSEPARRAPVRLTTCGGPGPLPGVDLDDSAALLELMEDAADLPERR